MRLPSLPSWMPGSRSTSTAVAVTESDGQRDQYAIMLRQEQETNLLLTEQITELESALTEGGWDLFGGAQTDTEFSRDGLRRLTALCRLTTIANPLVKRGVGLRVGYVWGLGVSIGARSKGDSSQQGQAAARGKSTQDVNAVVQAFLDDPSNRASWTGSQAREERERALATDGNQFVACFTAPLTGRVQVRTLPWDEITDVICNPEDRDEPWFYKREWTARQIDPLTGRIDSATHCQYYPSLDIAGGIPSGPGRRLRSRPRRLTLHDGDTGGEIQWDAPVLHVKVNALDGWKFGLPDVYAALPWSRAYKEFLEDWAKLVKSLSRFAWRLTTGGSKVSKVASRVRQAMATQPMNERATGGPSNAGAVSVGDPNVQLEAIPKTGATIDSESGRPLAAMVAAALGVPVTMLLGDPGTTGNRATAETLDRPTELEMNLRRELHTETDRRLLDYVIDQAVKAPQGPLKGVAKRDEMGREVVTLTGDTDGSMRTVDIAWPPLEDTPIDVLVKAIVDADSTGKLEAAPLVVARLLLEALGVDDVDEVLDQLVDENGEFIDAGVSAGDRAVAAFNRGEDPAAAVNGAPPAGQNGTGQ
jgi:hypothetical protein